jgi:hypothetical protein
LAITLYSAAHGAYIRIEYHSKQTSTGRLVYMRAFLLSALLVLASFGVAAAQPGTRQPERSVPLSALPTPDLPEGSKPSDYLRAAQGALAAGHTGMAEEALERAQTRLLDRSVPLFQTDNPSSNPISQQITQARQALAARDRGACMQLIQTAIASATAQGL